MRAAKQEWQQRQMEAFRNRRQVEGERADPRPAPSPLDAPPVYAPGKHFTTSPQLVSCIVSVSRLILEVMPLLDDNESVGNQTEQIQVCVAVPVS